MTRTAEALSPTIPPALLETFVRLLRALLPGAGDINVYDKHYELLWATDLAKSAQISELVARSAQDPLRDPSSPGQFQLLDSAPLYLFWLRPEVTSSDVVPLATLVIRLRTGANIESCSFGFVYQLLQPAIECMRQDIMAREEIARLRGGMRERPVDLDALNAISGGGPGAETDGFDDLKALLSSATTHMKVAMAALIVPDKGLAQVHAASDMAFDRRLFAKAHRQLLSSVRMRPEPVISNRMSIPANEHGVYRVLACRLCRSDGQAIGVIALFRPECAPEFTPYDAQVIALLARRIATVIAYDYDGLTGLFTRPAFERRMRSAVHGPQKVRTNWCALHIDVDHMYVINATHGMHSGDRVIQQLGELIRRHMPSGAIAARATADRFCILLPKTLDDAAKVAELLRQSMEQPGGICGNNKFPVSISIGVAPVPSDSRDLPHVLALAESACKAAKMRGANRVELSQDSQESIVHRMTDLRLVANLRSALVENTLHLAAQPIMALGSDGGPAHFELLLRMVNEKGKRVGPHQFMPLALRHQLVPQIDRWVIHRAIELLGPHRALLARNLNVFSINISGQSLLDTDFATQVEAMIAASGLNPAAFCFELTEETAMSNLPMTETFMRKLRGLGCNIALDDFGVGASSLAYLRSLPISMLKIDGCFVRDVLTDRKADSMVHAIAQLAHSMSLRTVAKHIETDEVWARIKELGVDYGQGFAIAAPAPLEEILLQLPRYATSCAISHGPASTVNPRPVRHRGQAESHN